MDVKTTTGAFTNDIHISFRELHKMANSECYFIYRVYKISKEGGYLCISENMKGVAKEILQAIMDLPYAVKPASVSLNPRKLDFSKAIKLATGSLEKIN